MRSFSFLFLCSSSKDSPRMVDTTLHEKKKADLRFNLSSPTSPNGTGIRLFPKPTPLLKRANICL